MRDLSRLSYVRVNFILPQEVYHALRILIPERKRSQVITALIKEEITRREKELYRMAQELEQDKELNQEMREWETTLKDGLGESEWI